MTTPDYAQYSLSDFLENDSFVRWVMASDSGGDPFWHRFLVHYPEKKEVLEQAMSLIRTYRQQDLFLNEAHQDIVWTRISNSIKAPSDTRVRIIPFYYKIAAAVILMLAAGAVLRLYLMPDRALYFVSTGYGEVKTIQLPDSSFVTLNGNSVVSYKKTWPGEIPREVWLEGEAYFDVQHFNKDTSHIVPHDRFIVHNGEMEIEVLGTTFNVEYRRNKTDLTLITGKVKVAPVDEPSGSRALILFPGDQLVFKNAQLTDRRKLQRPGLVTAWIRHEFVFIDPYLRDIVRTLEDDHGYAIEVKEDKLLELKIEGEINVPSIAELLSTVETTLGLSIKRLDKKIVIAKK
jgi:transmembrane sensor